MKASVHQILQMKRSITVKIKLQELSLTSMGANQALKEVFLTEKEMLFLVL